MRFLMLSRFLPTLVIACLGAAAFAVFTPSTALAQMATTTPRMIERDASPIPETIVTTGGDNVELKFSKEGVDLDVRVNVDTQWSAAPSDSVDLTISRGTISIQGSTIIAEVPGSDQPVTFGVAGVDGTPAIVVDIGVGGIGDSGLPPEGFRICLPALRGVNLKDQRLLRLDDGSDIWKIVEGSGYDSAMMMVCASGVGNFSNFVVGYEIVKDVQRRDLKTVLAGVGRTIASDAVEVLSGRFGASAGSQPKVTVGGQMLRLTGGKEGETLKQVTNVAVGVARMFGVTGGANGRTPEGTGDAAALSRHPGLFDGGTDRTNWRAPVRIRNVSVKDVLARSAFELPLSRTEDGGVAGLTLWGRGMASNFSGSPDTGFSMDGDLYSGYVGLDYRLDPKIMLGLAVSHATGDVDYEVTRATNRTKVGLDIQLTSVLPYAQWQPYAGLGVWGMFGAGWGEMDLDIAGINENQTTDLTLVMGALGGRQALISWNGIDFAAKADAFRSTLRSQGKENLQSARGNSGRMRLLVEGRTEYMISPESRLQPRLEVGGRWDSGDAEKGLGAEVGGGLAYTHTKLGLGVEAQGRYLLTHQEEEFEDWGASLKVRMDPGIKGQGFWLSMAPVWGRPATGAERLWGGAGSAAVVLDSSRDRSVRPGWAPGQLEMDFGYGVAVSDDGLVTPYGGLALGRSGAARYRFGSMLKLNTVLDLRVEGEREEQSGGVVSHGVMTRLNWQW